MSRSDWSNSSTSLRSLRPKISVSIPLCQSWSSLRRCVKRCEMKEDEANLWRKKQNRFDDRCEKKHRNGEKNELLVVFLVLLREAQEEEETIWKWLTIPANEYIHSTYRITVEIEGKEERRWRWRRRRGEEKEQQGQQQTQQQTSTNNNETEIGQWNGRAAGKEIRAFFPDEFTQLNEEKTNSRRAKIGESVQCKCLGRNARTICALRRKTQGRWRWRADSFSYRVRRVIFPIAFGWISLVEMLFFSRTETTTRQKAHDDEDREREKGKKKTSRVSNTRDGKKRRRRRRGGEKKKQSRAEEEDEEEEIKKSTNNLSFFLPRSFSLPLSLASCISTIKKRIWTHTHQLD